MLIFKNKFKEKKIEKKNDESSGIFYLSKLIFKKLKN
jgi:hypothetical protein